MRRITFSILLALLSSFTFLAAQPGNALSFDGANDNVTATLPPLFNNIAANDFTMEAWVYPTGAVFSRIIYAQSSTTNFATMSTGGTNQIYFYVIANGTTYSVATNATLPSNTWTHVAARWTAATLTPVVFFNGVQQATVAGGGSSTGSLNNLSIGTRPGGAQYFPGALDEVRIWSTARSQCAILANMNRTFPIPQANLVANYPFDQGVAGGTNTSVTSLNDFSGNGYMGTLNNFALSGATSNWIASAAAITSSGNDLSGTFQTAISANVCSGGSYTFPNGSTQTNITAPVVQTSTLTTSLGCDSTITTTLSILPTSLDTVAASVCSGGSYTFPNGSTQTNITAPVIQTSTLTNSLGCDSVITTTLSIDPISSDSVAAWVCSGSSYTFPDGSIDTNITTQVTQTSILQNSAGCDSVITTTVNVANNYFLLALDSICVGADYQFPDSTLITNITTTTTYTSQLLSVAGCDSFISTTVNPMLLDTAVTINGFTLTATASASGYQWINCATSLPVPNGNTQSYTPTANGSYAVVLSNAQGCFESSACFTVIVIGRPDASLPQLLAYPNPNPGSFLLRLPAGSPLHAEIEVFNAVGQRVYLGQATATEHQIQLGEAPAGVYTLRAHLADGSRVLRLVVQ